MKSGMTSPEISPNFKERRTEAQSKATWGAAGRVARQARKATRISTGGNLKPRAGRLGATPPRGLAGWEARRRAAVATGLRRVYRRTRNAGGPSQPRLAAGVIIRKVICGDAGRRASGNPPRRSRLERDVVVRKVVVCVAGSQLLRDSAAFTDRLGMPAGRRNRHLPPVSSSAKSSAATPAVGHRATRPGFPV